MTVNPPPPSFVDRHIGARRQADVDTMLKAVGYDTVDAPRGHRRSRRTSGRTRRSRSTAALSEVEVLAELRKLAAKNKTAVQMIGQGYYDTVTPPVIRRNILEAPAWYTAYTPYQPEISQGRLEALLNFQTMVQDLVGLPIANASLLDEATAVAEAVLLMRRANKNKAAHDGKTVLDADCLPADHRHRAWAAPRPSASRSRSRTCPRACPTATSTASSCSSPASPAACSTSPRVIAAAKERGALVTVAADLLALTLITPPGEQGADIAVGSAQRFGVPLFFGGPHAAYMAVAEGPGTLHARPPRGRLQGQRRRPGLPPGPADPRAAHPPREGHVQHLHRAGAAGHRVLVLRRLPRPGRAEGDRRDRPRPRPDPRRHR